jgi:hypothetical protein
MHPCSHQSSQRITRRIAIGPLGLRRVVWEQTGQWPTGPARQPPPASRPVTGVDVSTNVADTVAGSSAQGQHWVNRPHGTQR